MRRVLAVCCATFHKTRIPVCVPKRKRYGVEHGCSSYRTLLARNGISSLRILYKHKGVSMDGRPCAAHLINKEERCHARNRNNHRGGGACLLCFSVFLQNDVAETCCLPDPSLLIVSECPDLLSAVLELCGITREYGDS